MKSFKNKLALLVLIIITACGGSTSDETVNEEPMVEESGLVAEEVTYSLDTLDMIGYLAYDESIEGKRPGVIVVHEWWGLDDYTRMRTEKLAEMGYTAFAMDMYGDGKTADHPEDAGKFSSAVFSNIDNAEARFEKALELLKSHQTVDPDNIAAIGYCFGGGVVLHMARKGLDINGVVSFHGSLATQVPAQEGDIKTMVLVCHGSDDPFAPQETLDAFRSEFDNAKASYEVKVYEGARHSFTKPGSTEVGEKFNLPLVYSEEADKQSWQDMQDFFGKIFN